MCAKVERVTPACIGVSFHPQFFELVFAPFSLALDPTCVRFISFMDSTATKHFSHSHSFECFRSALRRCIKLHLHTQYFLNILVCNPRKILLVKNARARCHDNVIMVGGSLFIAVSGSLVRRVGAMNPSGNPNHARSSNIISLATNEGNLSFG